MGRVQGDKITLYCAHEYMKKTRIKKNCEKCNSVFEVHVYSIKNGHGKFCSLGCKSEDQKGQRRVVDNRKCLICKEDFYAAKWEDRRGKKKYCSVACVNKSRIGRIPPNKVDLGLIYTFKNMGRTHKQNAIL